MCNITVTSRFCDLTGFAIDSIRESWYDIDSARIRCSRFVLIRAWGVQIPHEGNVRLTPHEGNVRQIPDEGNVQGHEGNVRQTKIGMKMRYELRDEDGMLFAVWTFKTEAQYKRARQRLSQKITWTLLKES